MYRIWISAALKTETPDSECALALSSGGGPVPAEQLLHDRSAQTRAEGKQTPSLTINGAGRSSSSLPESGRRGGSPLGLCNTTHPHCAKLSDSCLQTAVHRSHLAGGRALDTVTRLSLSQQTVRLLPSNPAGQQQSSGQARKAPDAS